MSEYDALIIGGGPGGSSAATFLARAGKRVLVLEKEHFPRFHIGESLLPYNLELFRDMGIMPTLAASGFFRKTGAQFHTGSGAKGVGFVFRNGKFTAEHEAMQVERATFDHLLMKHARGSGADVREGWTVGKFTHENGGVAIDARSDSGQNETFRGKFLIDASGRGNVTGNQEGLREIHPRLRKLAVFGHFQGVKLDDGERAGDTVIVRLDNKWFWIIPLTCEKISVGCVMDNTEFSSQKKSPDEIFNSIWQSSPLLRERMANATPLGKVYVTSDFSYRNRRLVGPRLVRVGDAAGFLDPIFSSGVYIAMFSGRLAADAVQASLAANNDGAQRLKRYEKRVIAAMQFYWEMVEGFYTHPFMEILLEPREKFQLASAVNAMLAGRLEGGWSIRWRLRVFFWVAKLQSKLPLVPRIASFER